MNKDSLEGFSIFGIIIAVIVMIIISPLLYFLGGWITGCILSWTIGESIVRGLSFLNINITVDNLPLFCGVLGVIGSFFKSVQTSNKSNN